MQKYLNSNNLGLYADDTVIFSHAIDTSWLENSLQKTLDRFQKWCNMNALTINILKTKFMVFGTRSKIKKAKFLKLNIKGKPLQQVPSYKYLGLTLDPVLSYSKHISTILNTVSHKAYILSKIRCFITTYSSIRIFKSMILPYFDYADIVFAKANCADLDKLQRMQNRCIKTCLRVDKRTNTELIHSVAKTPKLEFRRITHIRNFMYKRLCNTSLLDIKPINTRSRDAPLFKVIFPNTLAFTRSVQYYGALEWNKLTSEIRNVDQFLSFKTCQLKWLNTTYQL